MREYVAELPPKYNLYTTVEEGCSEGCLLERLLSSPLGALLSESSDSALYRCPLLPDVEQRAAFTGRKGSKTARGVFAACQLTRTDSARAAPWTQELVCAQPGGPHACADALSPPRLLTLEEADIAYVRPPLGSAAMAVLPAQANLLVGTTRCARGSAAYYCAASCELLGLTQDAR